ncbi:MAG: pesticin C-terminus-like muramidase, partial [Nitrospira sp.]|nr:pesticin C-terminus-like muramidase [Nitrospira sp.]
MIRVILRHGDGLGNRAWLQTIVRHVQAGLSQAGHPIGLDGKFGADTETVVKTFQGAKGVPVTGMVDRRTWDALAPYLKETLGQREELIARLLPAFQGDPDWVHQQEGHKGSPYWPGGNSGVTLDPGIDLGQADRALVEQLFAPHLTAAQWEAVRTVFGIKGEPARQALERDPVVQSIRVTPEQADSIMPYAARPYWKDISDRFSSLKMPTTPAAVQTVLLSLAYNRGAQNE